MLNTQFGSVAANQPQGLDDETVRLVRVDFGHYGENSNLYEHPVAVFTPGHMDPEQFSSVVGQALWNDLQDYHPPLSSISEYHHAAHYYLATGCAGPERSLDIVDRDDRAGLRIMNVRPSVPVMPEHQEPVLAHVHSMLIDQRANGLEEDQRRRILSLCARPFTQGQSLVPQVFEAFH